MNKELQQRFYDRWPSWFRGQEDSLRENLMGFGFEHDDGWFELEWKLCEDLEKLVEPDYKLMQIKEKFGTLRWYDCGANAEAAKRIRQAEDESSNTCEVCGNPASLCTAGYWVKTLCEFCLEKGEFKGRYEKCQPRKPKENNVPRRIPAVE